MEKTLALIFAVVGAIAFTGCATIPRNDPGTKGLFQGGASSHTDASGDLKREIPVPVRPELAEFAWPLKEGKVTSLFGRRKRDYHEGIDIRSNRGTPIFATKDGEVIYSSRKIRGYGNMIVIKHSDGWASVYAHNKKNLASLGEVVKQGQLIALVGATGKATGPHLHFELRKGELPQDPLLYLPQLKTPVVANK